MKLEKTAFWILSFRNRSGKISKEILSHTQRILMLFQYKKFFLLAQYCFFYIYLKIEKIFKNPSNFFFHDVYYNDKWLLHFACLPGVLQPVWFSCHYQQLPPVHMCRRHCWAAEEHNQAMLTAPGEP